MIHALRHHLSRHVLAYLALFVALSGTSYAASRLPADSVGTEQITQSARTQIAKDAFSKNGPLPELGSGKTLRGNYSAGGPGTGGPDYATGSISFVFTLKSAPQPHYVKAGESPPPECPGSLANPKAAAGHLCLYESAATPGVTTRAVGDPVTDNASQANRYGAIVSVHYDGTEMFLVSGTWAVTSP